MRGEEFFAARGQDEQVKNTAQRPATHFSVGGNAKGVL